MAKQFDAGNLIFSLVIVRPREAFFEWLKPVLRKKDFILDQVYFPEENGVWIIPAIGTFNDTAEFEKYLEDLKPLIVKQEMGKFGPDVEDMPQEITSNLCNTYFDFEVRDRAQKAP